jgi:ribose/xylose/arabinose/galactoside ABC-type transport system permease subunit
VTDLSQRPAVDDRDTAAPVVPPEPSRWSRSSLTQAPELLVFLFLVILSVALTILESRFVTEINLQNIGRQTSVLLVLSAGVLFVLLVGGIDLSIGGMLAFTSVIAAHFANTMSPGYAFAIAIAATTCVGVANGLLIGIAGFSPIVVTLAVGQLLTGVALLMTANGPIQPLNPHYSDLATSKVGPIPTIVIAAVICLIAAHLLLTRTRLGRYIYSVGGNENAAWLAGVPTARIKIAGYTLCGLFAGAAGVLASSRIGSGDASLGPAEMLTAFAAVFLGGVGFGTGRGTVLGVALGALTLGVISDGIDLLQLDSDWQYIVSGALILIAIAFQTLPGKLRRRGA